MTTSVLMTHTPGELYWHDLQSLKDFALDAPFEWRMAFEQLISKAQVADRVEELEAKIQELQAVVSKASATLEVQLSALDHVLTENDGALSRDDIQAIYDRLSEVNFDL